MTVAGTAAGTAVDLAKLGIAVATIGVVGDDELGRWLRSKMASFGIDTDGLTTVSTRPTSATILPIRPNGERPALHVPGAMLFSRQCTSRRRPSRTRKYSTLAAPAYYRCSMANQPQTFSKPLVMPE